MTRERPSSVQRLLRDGRRAGRGARDLLRAELAQQHRGVGVRGERVAVLDAVGDPQGGAPVEGDDVELRAPVEQVLARRCWRHGYAAACIGVSPTSLTALTSRPSSSTSSRTASSTCASLARSWFDAHEMPAAAIRGVMPSSVSMVGSAPYSSSRRSTSTSAGLGGEHERGGPGHVPAVARARPARFLHRVAPVDVGAVVEQRAHDPQPVDVHRDELVADVPVGDVHGGLQRPAEDVAADDALRLALAVAELPDLQRHLPGPGCPAPSAGSIRPPRWGRRPPRAAGRRGPRAR